MQPFLFSYDMFGVTTYTLVYADKVENAYAKLDKLVNPTSSGSLTIAIKLATILP